MVGKNNKDQRSYSSHLFMVRLWPENVGDGQTDWRGKVQHVNSGEVSYFRDWLTLEIFMEGLLHRADLQACDEESEKRGRMEKSERDT